MTSLAIPWLPQNYIFATLVNRNIISGSQLVHKELYFCHTCQQKCNFLFPICHHRIPFIQSTKLHFYWSWIKQWKCNFDALFTRICTKPPPTDPDYKPQTKPQTPNPKPQTPSPKTQTPKPQNPNPKPQQPSTTLGPEFYIIAIQASKSVEPGSQP